MGGFIWACPLDWPVEEDTEVRAEATLRAGEVDLGFEFEFELERECVLKKL